MRNISSILFLGILFFVSIIYPQTPGYNWHKKAGGTGKDLGHAIAIGSDGTIYLTGEFTSTASFDPSVSATSAGNVDYFLGKYNNSGQAIWVKRAGGTLTDRGYAITSDNDYVYVTGEYFGTAQFENVSVTSSGNLDAFIAKYDTSGNLIWLREAKNGAQTSGRAITLDPSGNIIAAGYYGGTQSGTIYPTAIFNDKSINSNGLRDIFIVKYNQAGDVLWAKTAGGPFSEEEAHAIACDLAGNIYVGGNISDSASFGNILARSFGDKDAFLTKYDTNGNPLWVRTGGGPGEDRIKGLAVDESGNVYATGYFDSSATFGTSSLTGNDMSDIFIAKYSSDGDLLWLKQAGSSKSDLGYSIIANSEGCFITGKFAGAATFNNIDVASINGSDDAFIAHYDEDGNFQWIKQIGGSEADLGRSIKLDNGGNLYVCGSFKSTAYFDNNSILSGGAEDIFVTKLGNAPVPVELAAFNYSITNNSVRLQWTSITETNNAAYDIERSMDNSSFVKIGSVQGFGTTTEKHIYFFMDENVINGEYYYRLKQVDYDGTFTYSNILKASLNTPARFALHQNYPNPFNPETFIKFELPSDAVVSIRIFNMIGQEIAAPVTNQIYSQGIYNVEFNAGAISSGMYLYTLRAKSSDGTEFISSKKMTVIK